MKKIIYILAMLFYSSISHAEYIFVSEIPLKCDETKPILSKVPVPDHFKLNAYDAHQKAIEAQTVIKNCASKLEQVIYRDDNNYYLTNSVFLVGKMDFSKKVVVVNATTGVVEDRF